MSEDVKLLFFIAGAQKSGTTALDRFLRRNPAVQMATPKELHFFDDDRLDWSRPDYNRLHRSFQPGDPHRVKGEATPAYLYWPPALERIRTYNPEARIIVSLRHPTFRAFSHWRMASQRGREALSFAASISPEGRKRIGDAPSGYNRYHSYVERSLYPEQIRRLLALFPRDQVFFFKADDLWTNPLTVVGAVEDFIGVPRGNSTSREYIVPVETSGAGILDTGIRSSLDALFAPTIAETAALTGLDLSDWLAADYKEPMAPPRRGWLRRAFLPRR